MHRRRGTAARRERAATVASTVATALAFLLVWFGLTAPNTLSALDALTFVQIPLEAIIFAILAVLLPDSARRVLATLLGVLLAVVTVLKILDMGFTEALNRPFNAIIDWSYLDSALGLVDSSLGRAAAVAVLAAVVLLALALLVLMPLAVLRLSRVVDRHRTGSLRAAGALGLVWVVCAGLSVHLTSATPVASVGTAEYAYGHVSRIPSQIRDQRAFVEAAASDPLREAPTSRLLTGLRGKDVLFVFVESYGRVAVQGSSFSPGIDRVLDQGTERLQAKGFSSRSAFLTSPTFGALSWLAHATLQSGLWVDSQQRYDSLMTSDRSTLSRLFKRAGWRTVADVPANTRDWPQGAFYDFDQLYDSRNVGYAGPRFGYPTMPDQYTLDAFHRLELSQDHRKPVMAEIDLISSHAPWSRTPRMIDQDQVGDGSVFEGMPETLPSETDIWPSPQRVRAAYGNSIEYSLRALISFVESYADEDTVLVVLGDHQPATIVSGEDAGHDVPITVIAQDPAVMRRISGWGWQDGLNPAPDAPVWRMDAFRDRFLSAFGGQGR